MAADTLSSLLARAATKPPVRRFGDREAKLAEVVAAGVAADAAAADASADAAAASAAQAASGRISEFVDTTSTGTVNTLTNPETGTIVLKGGVTVLNGIAAPDPAVDEGEAVRVTVINRTGGAITINENSINSSPDATLQGLGSQININETANTITLTAATAVTLPNKQAMTFVYSWELGCWTAETPICVAGTYTP